MRVIVHCASEVLRGRGVVPCVLCDYCALTCRVCARRISISQPPFELDEGAGRAGRERYCSVVTSGVVSLESGPSKINQAWGLGAGWLKIAAKTQPTTAHDVPSLF